MEIKNNSGSPTTFEQWAALRQSVKDPVSILMPSYNECQVIETVVVNFEEQVLHYLPEGSEFIIEDSGSTDGTREILHTLQKRWPNIRLSLKDRKEGIPAALKSLIFQAKCPWVFLVDSDGQSLATEFWKLAPLMAESDFILGQRMQRHDAIYRLIGSRVFTFAAGLLFNNISFRDINAASRLCRREIMVRCAEHYGSLANAFFAESTIYAYCHGARISQVPVIWGSRLYGESHAFPQGTQWAQFFQNLFALRALKRRMAEKDGARQV